jgi:hypothetical protein
MKFFESHYDEYVREVERLSLQPNVKKIISSFPTDITELPNIIFYGPSGIGKYSHALYMISKYSPSRMKYEKRMAVSYNKDTFFIKISDVHFEVDMALLGCNSKHIWNEIYNQINDIVSSRPNTTAFIMCKNFQKIHSELLETFYSYMHNDNEFVCLKFILVTDHVSFIPDNVIQRCKMIPFKRPTMNAYNKCLFGEAVPTAAVAAVGSKGVIEAPLSRKMAVPHVNSAPTTTSHLDAYQVIKKTPIRITSKFELDKITNIKALKANITELIVPHENICNSLIDIILSPSSHLKFDALRDILYDLLIYDINIQECVWFIMEKLIKTGALQPEYMDDIMIKMFVFFQYFNNNYRPIYHLENFILVLICKIHGFKHQCIPTQSSQH